LKLGLLAPLLLLSCAGTPAPPSAPVDDIRTWLEVCAAHGYSQAETAMATGKEARDVAALQQKYRTHPPQAPPDRLLLLPYPGGRHPRMGFLEGAIDPHRDTKCSVFLPGGGYVVIDVPEAVWCDQELVYLAHTHIATKWEKRGISLDRIDWTREPNGVLTSHRRLPDGLAFGVRVEATRDGARMELRLTNGTDRTLSGLRAQVCVMLKGAPGFNAQTRDNKLQIAGAGVCAVRSEDGQRWIATCFEKPRLWENPPCPCIHADPLFPDLAPGEEAVSRGRRFVYEGEDLKAEVARRVESGTLIPR
jgi:hypothetical protein